MLFFLQIFHDRRLLRAHLRRFHSNAEVFCCEKCGKTFKDKRSAKVGDVTGFVNSNYPKFEVGQWARGGIAQR